MKNFIYLPFLIIISVQSCNNKKATDSNSIKVENVIDNKSNRPNIQTDTSSKIDNSINTKTQPDYFELISAESESWVAGIKGGGKGTEYYFKIKLNTNDPIKFDSVWVNNGIFKSYVTKGNSVISSKPILFSIGDTIIIRVSESYSTKPGAIPLVKRVAPINFDGKALIYYLVNGNRKYFPIKEIVKLSSPDRQ